MTRHRQKSTPSQHLFSPVILKHLQVAAAPRFLITSGFGLWLLLVAGCVGLAPEVPTPAADPNAGAMTVPPRSVLGVDEATRKTRQLLTATSATRIEGLKPLKHDITMSEMDHNRMKGMPATDHSKMPGMDHSRMPKMENGGKGQGTPQPQQHGVSSSHHTHGDRPAAPIAPAVQP